jgi:hypothetical protein
MPVRLNGDALNAAFYGPKTLLGTIVATTTKNNHSTAAAFHNTGEALSGKVLWLQPDAACYVMTGTANTTAATTSGVYLAARELYPVVMTGSHKFVACLAVSGTVNLNVFEAV